MKGDIYLDIKEKILSLLEDRTLTEQDIYKELGGEDPAGTAALNSLIANCFIAKSKSGNLGLPESLGLKRGKLEINRKGFGFVRCEGGDIYIAKEDMGGAMHSQTVLVRTEGDGERIKGRVVRVSAEPFFVTGTYVHSREGSRVVCDNPLHGYIHVPKKAAEGAEYGD